MSTSKNLISAASNLCDAVNALTFSKPVTHVYNPLDYAWESHKLYLTKYADSTKKVVMLGMNPGGYVDFLPFSPKALIPSPLSISANPG
jgi:single-strand selective monofunctional uracil DNA glycosylase